MKLAAIYVQCGPWHMKIGGYEIAGTEYQANQWRPHQRYKQPTNARAKGNAVPPEALGTLGARPVMRARRAQLDLR